MPNEGLFETTYQGSEKAGESLGQGLQTAASAYANKQNATSDMLQKFGLEKQLRQTPEAARLQTPEEAAKTSAETNELNAKTEASKALMKKIQDSNPGISYINSETMKPTTSADPQGVPIITEVTSNGIHTKPFNAKNDDHVDKHKTVLINEKKQLDTERKNLSVNFNGFGANTNRVNQIQKRMSAIDKELQGTGTPASDTLPQQGQAPKGAVGWSKSKQTWVDAQGNEVQSGQ